LDLSGFSVIIPKDPMYTNIWLPDENNCHYLPHSPGSWIKYCMIE
jgi:hypothetical protein